jgi:hypothetical protein
MSFEEIFNPGMRYLQEQKDFEEDDAHHLVAEGDPFLDMLESGSVSLESLEARPRAEGPADAEPPATADAEPQGESDAEA